MVGVRKSYTIEFPKVFSFIEEPDAALEVLERLVQVSRTKRPRIDVSQADCELIDHEAESSFSALALEATKRLRIPFSGSFPKSPELRNIVLAAGLPKVLGGTDAEPKGFRCFPLTGGRKARESAEYSSKREIYTTRLTEYVEECLLLYDFTLHDKAKEYLSSLVGEVIGNAEDHGGRPQWWVAGYLRQYEENIGDFHITIFNFGRTLYESLKELPADSRLRQDINSLVATHSKSGFFRSTHWTEENLWTLYALQEGVSRHNIERYLVGDRGQGTADMIEFFQRLGQTTAEGKEPKMCVVSGRTHILFNNTYKMKRQSAAGGEERRIIAFNDENDLHRPPNNRNVRSLSSKFPGTLIGLRFFLDQSYLSRVKEESNDEEN